MQASMQIFSSVFHRLYYLLYLFVPISLMAQADHTEVIGTLTEIKGGGNSGLWVTLTTRVPFMIKNVSYLIPRNLCVT